MTPSCMIYRKSLNIHQSLAFLPLSIDYLIRMAQVGNSRTRRATTKVATVDWTTTGRMAATVKRSLRITMDRRWGMVQSCLISANETRSCNSSSNSNHRLGMATVKLTSLRSTVDCIRGKKCGGRELWWRWKRGTGNFCFISFDNRNGLQHILNRKYLSTTHLLWTYP